MSPARRDVSVDSDAGFTLPELLVAITIMVLVMGTLGFTLVSVLRTMSGAMERAERSKDTTLVGYVFPSDINSASAITTGGVAPCGTGTPLFTLTTTNVRTTSNKSVWYAVNAGGALMRFECATGGGVANSTQLADSVSNPVITCEKQTATTPYFATVAGCAPVASVNRVAFSLTLNPATRGTAVDVPQPLTLFGVMP